MTKRIPRPALITTNDEADLSVSLRGLSPFVQSHQAEIEETLYLLAEMVVYRSRGGWRQAPQHPSKKAWKASREAAIDKWATESAELLEQLTKGAESERPRSA